MRHLLALLMLPYCTPCSDLGPVCLKSRCVWTVGSLALCSPLISFAVVLCCTCIYMVVCKVWPEL